MSALNFIVGYASLATSHVIAPVCSTPAIPVYDAQLRRPIGSYEQQPQISVSRIDLMTTTYCKYKAIVAGSGAKRAISSTTPNEVVVDAMPGLEILLCHEKSRRDGPYTFFTVKIDCLLC